MAKKRQRADSTLNEHKTMAITTMTTTYSQYYTLFIFGHFVRRFLQRNEYIAV